MTPFEQRRLLDRRKELVSELDEIDRQLQRAHLPEYIDAGEILARLKAREEAARTRRPIIVTRETTVHFAGVTYTAVTK